MTLDQLPVVVLYELAVKEDKWDEFLLHGKKNLKLSIMTEPETWALHLMHENKQQTGMMFEIYQDLASQKRHQASPQYKKYASFTQNALVKRQITEFVPELLLERFDFLNKDIASHIVIVMKTIELKTASSAAFKAVAFKEAKQSLALEEGVLARYLLTLKNHPEKWLSLEFYFDKKAYKEHLKTPHFATYSSKAASLIVNEQVRDLVADTLVSQAGLKYERG